MILTPEEFALSAQNALDSLGPIQDLLMDIQDEVPVEMWPGIDAQLDTLFKLEFEIGPRLIIRILEGETDRAAALQRAVEAATVASEDIIRDYESNYTLSSSISNFLGDSIGTIGQVGESFGRGSFGIGIGIGIGVLALVLLR